MEKERCKQKVADGWHHYECSRNVWKDGYCKQHHPDTVAARQAKIEARYEEKWKQSAPYKLSQANKRITKLEAGIMHIAIECNCRAEHGAEGGEHLLFIEKMLRDLIKEVK